MNHHEAVELVPRLLGGDLAPWSRVRMRWHLRRCPVCRQEVRAYRELDRAAREQFHRHTNTGVISQRFLDGLANRLAAEQPRRPSRRWYPVAALAALVVVSITIVATLVFLPSGSLFTIPEDASGTVVLELNGFTAAEGSFTYESPAEWAQRITVSVAGFSGGFSETVEVTAGNQESGEERFRELLNQAERAPAPEILTVGDALERLQEIELSRGGPRLFNGEELKTYRGADHDGHRFLVGVERGQLRFLRVEGRQGSSLRLVID